MLGFSLSKNNGSQVGVDFMPTGVSVVEVATNNKMPGQVRQSDFLPAVGNDEQSRALQQWVHSKGLRKTPCFSLIAKHDVQLFQLEKPAVDESELLQAVSWKIKDLVSFDVNSAVLDIFEYPPSSKSPVRYLNAVVANESVVSNYVEMIRKSGLDLKVIDVHDLASRNYAALQGFEEQTVGILQFSNNEGMLSIFKGGDLYVTRGFKLGMLQLEADRENNESLYDSLLLELQRSLDYFESTFSIGLVQQMIIFPQTPATEKMAAYVQNNVGYDLDFARINMHQKNPSESLDPRCFAAYCAALRRDT